MGSLDGCDGGSVRALNLLLVEAGDALGEETRKKLIEAVATSAFADCSTLKDLDEEAIEALNQQVETIVLVSMGAVGDVLGAIDEFTPDWYRLLEEVQDALAGSIGVEVRGALANFEISVSLEDFVCEIYE